MLPQIGGSVTTNIVCVRGQKYTKSVVFWLTPNDFGRYDVTCLLLDQTAFSMVRQTDCWYVIYISRPLPPTTMFDAGHDTTASSISWTLYALSTHPDCQRRAQAEIDALLDGRDDEDVTWWACLKLFICDLVAVVFNTVFDTS